MNQTQSPERLRIAWRLERLPSSKPIFLMAVALIVAYLIEATDNGAIGYFLPVLAKEYTLTPSMMGFVGTISNVGIMVGAALSGYLCDVIGRKLCVWVSMLIFGAFGVLLSTAADLNTVMIARAGIGLGMGGFLPAVTTYLSEMVPSKLRVSYMSALLGCTAGGYMLAGIMSYYFIPIPGVGWRGVSLLIALLSLFAFVIAKYVPESPLWLESKGRFEEADRIMREIEQKVERSIGRVLPEVVVPSDYQQVDNQKVGLGAIFGKEYLATTIMVTIWWTATVGANVGLTTWFSTLMVAKGFTIQKSIGFVTLMFAGGFLGFPVVRFLAKRLGHKWTTSVVSVLVTIVAFSYGNSETLPFILLFGVLYNCFAYSSAMINNIYTTELYSNRVRGTAIGWGYICARCGAIFIPLMFGFVMQNYGVPAVGYSAAALYLLAAVVVALVGKEGTKVFTN
jgi:putative MFS transporter